MTEFLGSLKADLLDRRFLPLVALVVAALLGAFAYVVLGGGSTATTPTAAVSPNVADASTGLTVSQSSPEKAVAEVTNGGATQHHGTARNPFTPLPEEKAQVATTSAGSTTSAGGSSGTSSRSGSSSTSTTPTTTTPTTTTPSAPTKPATPSKPKTVYHVAVLVGELATGVTLTPIENLKLVTPLPSDQLALVVFRGVTAGGKSATFTLVGEAILHGAGTCLPTASQCEAIDLRAGQSEQLEYLKPTGQTVTYELRVVSITSEKASSAVFKDSLHGTSKVGRELLSHEGLETIPYLRFSATAGVLVFAGHGAFAARAHSAAHRHHSR
jgi:cytoskeletal protein RodZ